MVEEFKNVVIEGTDRLGVERVLGDLFQVTVKRVIAVRNANSIKVDGKVVDEARKVVSEVIREIDVRGTTVPEVIITLIHYIQSERDQERQVMKEKPLLDFSTPWPKADA